MSRQRLPGFSLVEVLIALSVAALLLSGALAVLRGARLADARSAAAPPELADSLLAVARLAPATALPAAGTRMELASVAAVAADAAASGLLHRVAARGLVVHLGVRALETGLVALTLTVTDRRGRVVAVAAAPRVLR
jgi:prepilin-type N-terminal cleavage/methylation domain-containing protein